MSGLPFPCAGCKRELPAIPFSEVFFDLCRDCVVARAKEKIPAQFAEADLADFPDVKLADPFESLYLFGPVGTGKTRFLWAKVKAMTAANATFSRVVKFDELLRRLRSCFQDGGGNEEAILAEYAGAKRLAIDDLGGIRDDKASAWALSAVFEVIDHRYERKLGMDVTANKDLDELARVLDVRIASRLAEACRQVEFKGADRRVPR